MELIDSPESSHGKEYLKFKSLARVISLLKLLAPK